MKVALYARVSTQEQTFQPQIDRLREWAARSNLEVGLESSDTASGKLVRRPGQERIMQEARGHHIQAVAVAKIDRWARSMQHLATTVKELHELGVDFYAVDQGLVVRKKDPTSTLILHILGACAEWEGSIISERTKDSMAALKAAGKHVGRPRKGVPSQPPQNPTPPPPMEIHTPLSPSTNQENKANGPSEPLAADLAASSHVHAEAEGDP